MTRSYIMRFGLFTGTTGIAWPQLQSLWQHIEATGWGAACVTDHFMPNTRDPVDDTLECWTALSGLRLWTQPKTTLSGKYYQLPAAPLFPKPLQQPHPELLIGGGGEQRTLRIAAKYADHWNTWGGPETLRHKGEVLDKHCATVGRDPAQIMHSANMPMAITENPEDGARLVRGLMQRFGLSEERSRDTVLAGSVAQIQDKLGRLQASGGDQLYIPTFLPPWNPEQLDRFITEV